MSFANAPFTRLLLSACLVGAIAQLSLAAPLMAQTQIAQDSPAESDLPTDSPEAPSEAPPEASSETPETAPESTETPPDVPESAEPESPESESATPDATTREPANNNTPSLINQCRLTNRTLSVFTKPTVAEESEIVATLDPETPVVLASAGHAGWIKISEPARGFVIARHLTRCPSEPEPPQPATTAPPSSDFPFAQDPTLLNITSGACRQAIVDLAIRPAARSEARPFIGSIKEGETMTLTGESVLGDEYRLWLQISRPYLGWISGGVEGGTNLAFCG
ncbi:MAG: hypothetical protein AAGG51_02550 [Cyanobacteria bacterium P01_G01_bin.54]